MLTDTHAHLDFPKLLPELPAVLDRAAAAEVTRIITIGTTVLGSRQALDLATGSVFAAAGIHPNNAVEEPPGFIPALREMAASPRIVALGEMGLDYHYLPRTGADAAKAEQATVFRAQLDLAAELKMPVIIHERDAWEDTLAILSEYTGAVRAVFHCFGKSPLHARTLLAMGHIVSFTGIVTYKNAPEAQAAARDLPAGSFMVETDCPFLAPVPNRGKTNEPAMVRHTAEFIAQLRGTTLAEVAAMTGGTADAFFRFPQ